jgi:hypothetical protein
MADSVTAAVLLDNNKQHVVHLTGISDGTGEAAVVKIDKSAIGVASDGAEAASLDIEFVQWNIFGYSYITLLWDHTTDDRAMVLAGVGQLDFSKLHLMDRKHGGLLVDPRSSGGTGDLLLTTTGHDAGDAYDILIGVRKAAD